MFIRRQSDVLFTYSVSSIVDWSHWLCDMNIDMCGKKKSVWEDRKWQLGITLIYNHGATLPRQGQCKKMKINLCICVSTDAV